MSRSFSPQCQRPLEVASRAVAVARPFIPSSGAYMNRLTTIARNFVKDEDGAALLEYGMLVLLIAVLCIVAIKTVGSKINNGFQSVNSSLP